MRRYAHAPGQLLLIDSEKFGCIEQPATAAPMAVRLVAVAGWSAHPAPSNQNGGALGSRAFTDACHALHYAALHPPISAQTNRTAERFIQSRLRKTTDVYA